MDATAGDEKGFTLERAINGLQSCDKSVVKQSIAEIAKFVSRTDTSRYAALYEQLEKPLINALHGNVETCREKAIALIQGFIKQIDVDKKYLSLLIPILHNRIGTDNVNEPSEEIRDSILNLLDFIIEKYSEHLSPYVVDIVAILCHGLSDPAPLVKRTSCKGTVSFSSLVPHDFFPYTKNFIGPLTESITHQHWRVRVAVIEAIGSVMQHGDNKLVADTTNALAKRLFDDTPNVRLAVVKVVGVWLLKLPDRYSFFPHLLPHILTSLTESNNEVKETAAKYWDMIGHQFLYENEKDFKDIIDLGNEKLDHYPPDVSRPKLGCRCLVQREAFKFLPAIAAELSDWLIHVKIKSAQLLSQVILHAESKITQHVPKIIPAMAKSAADPEPLVSEYVKLSALYMGYFVPAEVYTKLIVDNISDSPSCGELEMVAALISGSEAYQLVPHLTSIVHIISSSSTKAPEQAGMNAVVKSIMSICKKDSLVIGNEIWSTIVSNYSLAASDVLTQESIDVLSQFSSLHEDLPKKDVNVKYSQYLLNKLKNTSMWTVHCHDQFIFSGLISIAGEIVGEQMDDIMIILKNSTSENSDPEVILKMVLACHTILQEHDITLPNEQLVQQFVNTLIEEILLTQLVWKPGRSAEALRSGATLTLFTSLQLHIPKEIEKLLPVVLSLIEDAAPRTRALALRALCELATPLSTDADTFSKNVQAVLKRLDDCDKGVRELSVSTIKSLCKAVLSHNDHKLYPSNVILEFIYSTMLIHLDDQDKSIQTLVLDCLTLIAEFNAKLLRGKLANETFRDKDIREVLLKILDDRISITKIDTLEEQLEQISV